MSERVAIRNPNAKVPDLMTSGILQRKCAGCGNHTVGGGECSECEGKKKTLQRHASSSEAVNEVPPIVHEVLRSPGQQLDTATRTFLEPRFGYDFSKVRLHTDERATASARAVNALAYTVGNNIVFDQDLHDPGSDSSAQKLLAHELAHVVQQHGETDVPPSQIKIGSPSDPAEKDADRLAGEVTASSPFNASSISSNGGTTRQERGSAGTLQRVVNEHKVGCRDTGIPSLGLSGADAVQAIRDANEEAIVMSQRAENLLFIERLTFGLGAPDPDFTTILNEELGLDINNADDRRRMEIVQRRFELIRSRVLESDFTGYTCIGAAAVSLAPGTPAAVAGPCCTGGTRACSSVGVSHMVLCRPWWNLDVATRPSTIIHEPFHIYFDLDDFVPAKLNDAHCYAAFAMRLAGRVPTDSCAGR